MSASDAEQSSAKSRLVSAMTRLEVFSRTDDQGRVLAFDGTEEYEVIVDLDRLLTKRSGPRRIVVGKVSLPRLEAGDVGELFPHRVSSTLGVSQEAGINARPVSPHYRPLRWVEDEDNLDDDDAIAAQGEDWAYRIYPVRGNANEVIGYRVSGGDYESGRDSGAFLIDGKPGEMILAKAQAAAQENYVSRYLEAEGLLDGIISGWEDEDGPRTRRSDQGRILCRVDGLDIEEVEVVATLRDLADGYDASDRCVTVCLRTILSCCDDRSALLDFVQQMIRQEN